MKIIKEDIIDEMPKGLEFDSVSFLLKGNTTLKMSAQEFSDWIKKMTYEATKQAIKDSGLK